MRLALGTALVGTGTDELLPFEQQGRVEQEADGFRQRLQAAVGDLVKHVRW